MKNILPYLFGVALLPIAAQAQSTSNVVGYETLPIDPGFNFISTRLHPSIIVSGELDAVTATTATDNDVDFVATLGTSGASGTYILEIEGTDGIIQETTTWTTDTLDVADLSGVTTPVNYSIRAAATMETTFGAANEAGLAPGNGSSGGADQIWLWNGSGWDQYYFDNFGPQSFTPAWVDIVNGVEIDPSTVDLVYADAFVVVSASGNDITVSGELKTAPTELTLVAGFNFVGSVAPVGASIETAFGAANEAGLSPGNGSSGGADQIWIFNGSGWNQYYFDNFGPQSFTPAWVDIVNGVEVDPSTVALESGYAIVGASAKSVTQGVPASYDTL